MGRLILDINQSLFSHLVMHLNLQDAKSFSNFKCVSELQYVGFDVSSKTENPIYYNLKQ